MQCDLGFLDLVLLHTTNQCSKPLAANDPQMSLLRTRRPIYTSLYVQPAINELFPSFEVVRPAVQAQTMRKSFHDTQFLERKVRNILCDAGGQCMHITSDTQVLPTFSCPEDDTCECIYITAKIPTRFLIFPKVTSMPLTHYNMSHVV